jgi:hypothetical protein
MVNVNFWYVCSYAIENTLHVHYKAQHVNSRETHKYITTVRHRVTNSIVGGTYVYLHMVLLVNIWKNKKPPNDFKNLLPTSKQTQCTSNDKIKFLMLLSEIIFNVFQKNTKHTNTLSRQNVKILALKCRDIQKLVNEFWYISLHL